MAKKIMVLDDESNTVELVKAVLEIGGFEVLPFTEPNAALEHLEKGDLPDLMLLDMRMPAISGPDLCDKLAQNPKFRELKIVFFTASSDFDRGLLQKHGVKGFIFKPFDNDGLVAEVKKYLGI